MGRIRDWFEEENGFCKMVFGGIASVVFAGVFTFVSCVTNGIVSTKYLSKTKKDLEEKRVVLQENIASYVKDINDFELASVELLHNNENYICKAFGRTGIKSVLGLEEDKYVNIFFNISQDKAQTILDKIEAFDKTGRMKKNDSPENSLVIKGGIKCIDLSVKGKLKKSVDACMQVFDAIDNAVKNAYEYKIDMDRRQV